MHAKLALLRRLLDDGYEMEEIRTEGRVLEAVLAKRGLRTIIRFDRSAAEALLFGDRRRRDLLSR